VSIPARLTSRDTAERGIVLVISLIMLIIVTLLGTSSANLVRGNLKVVENIEARAAVRNAALGAIEEAVAYGQLLDVTTPAFTATCGGSRSKCVDATGDGTVSSASDIQVTLTTPVCVAVTPVKNSSLNVFSSTSDASCFSPGVFSLCADTLWEVTAVAVDPVTGASVTIREGIESRTTLNAVAAACP
jgi:Tfp pilus assembly protein PilX